MQFISVSKVELIEQITTNLAEHKDVVAQAQVRYRERVIEELDKRLADAKAGRKIDQHINLPMPTDYSEECENALAQLEWEVEDVVTLEPDDFNRLVLNKWRWAAQFAGTSLAYANNEI